VAIPPFSLLFLIGCALQSTKYAADRHLTRNTKYDADWQSRTIFLLFLTLRVPTILNYFHFCFYQYFLLENKYKIKIKSVIDIRSCNHTGLPDVLFKNK